MTSTPQQPRLQVDFNRLVRGGQVLYSHRRVDPDLAIGDTVVAEDSIEGMEFTATVADINTDTGYVYLAIDWEPANPEIRA